MAFDDLDLEINPSLLYAKTNENGASKAELLGGFYQLSSYFYCPNTTTDCSSSRC
jgi:hypothetical protein